MYNTLAQYAQKPDLYAPSTGAFWDDEHISKNMLEAHLNPDVDAASRRPEFLDRSASWIAKIAPPNEYPALLDLGCGPGLYSKRFSAHGYLVTGVDYSKRSIAYAKEQAALNKSAIEYIYKDYLTIDYSERFDVITLIYCDYAALSKANRLALLNKIHAALKPGGRFFVDLYTPRKRSSEGRAWLYNERGGFFSPEPHFLFETVWHYGGGNIELHQYIVLTERGAQCHHIWDHFFTHETLEIEVCSAGFKALGFFGDIAGAPLSGESETICGVFVK